MQELNESRVRMSVSMEEVDGRLQQEYEGKLEEALRHMREENDEQIRMTREETESVFNAKVRATT